MTAPSIDDLGCAVAQAISWAQLTAAAAAGDIGARVTLDRLSICHGRIVDQDGSGEVWQQLADRAAAALETVTTLLNTAVHARQCRAYTPPVGVVTEFVGPCGLIVSATSAK